MTKMTKTQVLELKAPSTKYSEAAYQKVIDDLVKSGKTTFGFMNVEKDFPGVKPQHVAWMLKNLRGENALDIVIHSEYGVCISKEIEVAEAA